MRQRSRNLPPTQPLFFWGGSKTATVSSARKYFTTKMRPWSSGAVVSSRAMKRRILRSFSIMRRKFFLGTLGMR